MKAKSKPAGFVSHRKSSSRQKHLQYETLKAALPIDLTPRQYEAACLRIARELGV